MTLALTQISMKPSDYIRANRKGSREAELEDSTGFTNVHKVHKSYKSYSRKVKHKKSN